MFTIKEIEKVLEIIKDGYGEDAIISIQCDGPYQMLKFQTYQGDYDIFCLYKDENNDAILHHKNLQTVIK